MPGLEISLFSDKNLIIQDLAPALGTRPKGEVMNGIPELVMSAFRAEGACLFMSLSTCTSGRDGLLDAPQVSTRG